jgi:hypothetical protein
MVKDFAALESQQFKPDADGHLFLITPAEMADLANRSGFAMERLSLSLGYSPDYRARRFIADFRCTRVLALLSSRAPCAKAAPWH